MGGLKACVWLVATAAALFSSIAEAQVGVVHVNGTLYCSSNGTTSASPTPTPVFSNATLQVGCTTVVIANAPATAVTDHRGAYLVVLIPTLNATISSIISGCRLRVLTRLSTCKASLPASHLVSNLRYVKTVPVGPWYITYLAASGFTLRA